MHAFLCELRGPEMTTHPPIFALPTLWTIDGDQDMEAHHSRRGKTLQDFDSQDAICSVIYWSKRPVWASTRGYGTKMFDKGKCF